MFRIPVLLPTLCILLSLFTARATAQMSPDPASATYSVELNGTPQPNEVYIFISTSPFGGVWMNFDGDNLYGWGTYTWDPIAGTVDYINVSGDGGGVQTGTYWWMNNRWVRTHSSHPDAPPLELIPN